MSVIYRITEKVVIQSQASCSDMLHASSYLGDKIEPNNIRHYPDLIPVL
jgi:hypothetical protein